MRISVQPPTRSTVVATCPRCGAAARVSSHGMRFDETVCELSCMPRSCVLFATAIAAAQDMVVKFTAGMDEVTSGRPATTS